MSVIVRWAGETLTLLPQRAIHWPANETLILADPHFGKGAHFRLAGIPVPEAAMLADIQRLDALIGRHRPRRVVVLGDFFHARSGRTTEAIHAVEAMRFRHAKAHFLNVRGNHDRYAGDPPPEWMVECATGPVRDGPFIYGHDPAEVEGLDEEGEGHALCGHLHPAVHLHDPRGGGFGLTVACFWLRPRLAVLPAFVGFAGTCRIRPVEGDRVYALLPNEDDPADARETVRQVAGPRDGPPPAARPVPRRVRKSRPAASR